MFYFDTTYLWFMLPCIILSLICQVRVKSAFSKYGKIPNSRRMTGAQAAEYVLRQNGVTGVRIEHVSGNLTDHYDPRTNVIRLSDAVYNVTSVAAVGVAAHEAGHAVQTALNYAPNKIRSAILPVARLGSGLSWILIAIGLLFAYRTNNPIGLYCLYGGIILFDRNMESQEQVKKLNAHLQKEAQEKLPLFIATVPPANKHAVANDREGFGVIGRIADVIPEKSIIPGIRLVASCGSKMNDLVIIGI